MSRTLRTTSALGLVLVGILIPIALIDLEHRIIPNKVTFPAAVAAALIGLVTRPSGVPEQLVAGAPAGGFLLLFALAYPRRMGMGDVKLAAVLGLFLGRSVAVAVLAGVLAGAVVGGAIMARLGVARGRKTAVPFAPFLALGGIVALLAGRRLSTGISTRSDSSSGLSPALLTIRVSRPIWTP